MTSRGFIIGKIIDDLSNLSNQIESRNKLGQFDLTKVSEDFFKEVLNCVFKYGLINLNRERTNNPGLDLGENGKVAFQITSTKRIQKIEKTLSSITSAQLSSYPIIKILIIGKKEPSYKKVKKTLLAILPAFDIEKDILDIYDLMKEISVMDIADLFILHDIFMREFQNVKIELEPVGLDGSFESSNYARLEKVPDLLPKNATKFINEYQEYTLEMIIKLYKKLSKIPRASREYLAIIAERGKLQKFNYIRDEGFGINSKKLSQLLHISQQELKNQIEVILEEEQIYIGETGDNDEYTHIVIANLLLNDILLWTLENKLSPKVLLNRMDFTILDKE